MKKLLCATAAFCLVAAPAFAATKIIFVGNSFTFGAHSAAMHYETDQVKDLNPPDNLGRTIGGVPALFKEFTKEAGLDYDVSLETVGGKGFDFHMKEKRAVIDGNYDFVIGQSYSTLDEAHPGDPALLVTYTKQMADMFAAKNPQVKFYLLASWSRADKIYPGRTRPRRGRAPRSNRWARMSRRPMKRTPRPSGACLGHHSRGPRLEPRLRPGHRRPQSL